jgi:hypothetical protein
MLKPLQESQAASKIVDRAVLSAHDFIPIDCMASGPQFTSELLLPGTSVVVCRVHDADNVRRHLGPRV